MMPYFSLNSANKIITEADAVASGIVLNNIKNTANGLYGTNSPERCDDGCSVDMLYYLTGLAKNRTSDMIDNVDFQQVIAKILKCVSLNPQYYIDMNGSNYIDVTIGTGSGSAPPYVYLSQSMEFYPTANSTVIPANTALQDKLKDARVINVFREGMRMQSIDNSRSNYYTFDSTAGQITLKVAANGDELFSIDYETKINL